MKLLSASIAFSAVVVTAGVAIGGRYDVAVSSNAQSAWILDKWSGELTFCRPSFGQMASYIDTLQSHREGLEDFTDVEIVQLLPGYDPALFGDISMEEIARMATRINSCLPGR
ncbi:MAG: hypothetical protein Q8L60_10820 [Gammaproteobacteria bacterium]|nr:hypothetical protein [Gammaproteobacteria bacterium]MDP2346840.1 hypothetical protein [Gammaproteobacteria bacterium]